jgi:sterol desaturase/sphingolipid hydroxylase (fatty acid hydroxylase superfamily)
MIRSVIGFAVGFGVLAAVFGAIEWRFAARPRSRRTGRALRTDMVYWPLQVLEMLVAGDFLGYWPHRAFHRGRLYSRRVNSATPQLPTSN